MLGRSSKREVAMVSRKLQRCMGTWAERLPEPAGKVRSGRENWNLGDERTTVDDATTRGREEGRNLKEGWGGVVHSCTILSSRAGTSTAAGFRA